MAKLCESGFKISSIDQKASEHCLLVSPRKWAEDALKGMINRAVKTILKDWFDSYKASQATKVSVDLAIVIPAIIALPAFSSYNLPSPEAPVINRKVAADQEIWTGGLDLQDYELAALNAYYADPEVHLRYLMQNKIDYCRKQTVKEFETALMNDPEVTEMPSHADDLIAQETAKAGYQNRAERESAGL
jgi:hypothetical protein